MKSIATTLIAGLLLAPLGFAQDPEEPPPTPDPVEEQTTPPPAEEPPPSPPPPTAPAFDHLFRFEEIAATAHVPGRELAKTVMVKVDGRMAMAVLPASRRVDFHSLGGAAGTPKVELATEEEFDRWVRPEAMAGFPAPPEG